MKITPAVQLTIKDIKLSMSFPVQAKSCSLKGKKKREPLNQFKCYCAYPLEQSTGSSIIAAVRFTEFDCLLLLLDAASAITNAKKAYGYK